MLASAREPAIPPEAIEPPATAGYVKFHDELARRQQKLADFVAAKHRELVENAKTRVAEYLVAAQQALDRPTTEDFMLIADGNDLNPAMVVRWQTYLLRTRKDHDPVFAPWHALASVPPTEFAAHAARWCAGLARQSSGDSGMSSVNPVIAAELTARPPRSLDELASLYAHVLRKVEHLWQDAAHRATLDGRVPTTLPEPALEAIRQVFYGPDSPPNVVMLAYGDLGLLPDRASQAKLQQLRNAVQNWLTGGPGAPPRVLCVEEAAVPFDAHVFIRGNPQNLGQAAPRQFLAVVAGLNRRPFQHGSGRLELAQAIAARSNPLTARAIVNRIWMHHFGTPLVATPSDFGTRSEPPSHPELLDHLATRFMDDNWSIKSLHRTIMLSSTYQQTSDDRPEARAVDPENGLYWRMNRRRVDFEAMRDALLTVSGRLDRTIGGPPIKSLTAAGADRRTLYGFIDRLNLPGVYRTFDFPDPTTTSPRRDTTTVAPQALFLMNHPFVVGAARGMLARPEIAVARSIDDKVEQLYRTIYGRLPGNDERAWARQFLAASTPALDRWPSFAQALLMANEFLFVD